MKQLLLVQLERIWREDEAVLSFEWVLLLTLLTIGIVGGLAAARDAIIDELGDIAEAAICIDQSYFLQGDPNLGIPDSEFQDTKPQFSDCTREPLANQQDPNGGGNPP
jgi:hypothetical protein